MAPFSGFGAVQESDPVARPTTNLETNCSSFRSTLSGQPLPRCSPHFHRERCDNLKTPDSEARCRIRSKIGAAERTEALAGPGRYLRHRTKDRLIAGEPAWRLNGPGAIVGGRRPLAKVPGRRDQARSRVFQGATAELVESCRRTSHDDFSTRSAKPRGKDWGGQRSRATRRRLGKEEGWNGPRPDLLKTLRGHPGARPRASVMPTITSGNHQIRDLGWIAERAEKVVMKVGPEGMAWSAPPPPTPRTQQAPTMIRPA